MATSRERPATAIIGVGVTGLSCLRYLAARCERLLVLDTRAEPPVAATNLADYPQVGFHFGPAVAEVDFAGVAEVVVSPGIELSHPLVQRALAAGAALQSDIDLFLDAIHDAPVLAVTGTNGKSTVTALTGHLLRALGHNPGVGGNLGEPALDLLGDTHDSYVLELSSFQLERMRVHPFAAATILNISDDHLDRHGDLDAYTAAKQRIYRGAFRTVANRADDRTRPDFGSAGEQVTFGLDRPAAGHWGLIGDAGSYWLALGDDRLLPMTELPLQGLHNAENALAALALTASAADLENADRRAALLRGLRSFVGLPHRCQFVAAIRGVRFVNDSKATNVGATLAALAGLGDPHRQNLILIAGGDGKGADFAPLRAPVAQFVKAVVLIGRDAPQLAAALEGAAPLRWAAGMNDAVSQAMTCADRGDTVLLAPACASLDMFRSYAARGDAFATAVESLA